MVVVDDEGNKVPLGSEEAQQIVNSGDPVWCPATLAKPTPGMNGCSNPAGGANYDATSLTSLLNYLSANQPLFAKNGTIWIENSYVSSANDASTSVFYIDGNSGFGTMKNYTLTIQGGWNGQSGSNTITGVSEFDVPLQIWFGTTM